MPPIQCSLPDHLIGWSALDQPFAALIKLEPSSHCTGSGGIRFQSDNQHGSCRKPSSPLDTESICYLIGWYIQHPCGEQLKQLLSAQTVSSESCAAYCYASILHHDKIPQIKAPPQKKMDHWKRSFAGKKQNPVSQKFDLPTYSIDALEGLDHHQLLQWTNWLVAKSREARMERMLLLNSVDSDLVSGRKKLDHQKIDVSNRCPKKTGNCKMELM